MTAKPSTFSMVDVARRAGVAQSTVSYVLSGSRKISDKTRRQVERAIAELGYTPHAAAQALRGDKSDTLVLSLPADEGVTSVVIGVYVIELAQAARRSGLDLLLATDADQPERALQKIIGSRRADAVILMSIGKQDPRVAVAVASGIPAVSIGRPDPDGDLAWVDFDFATAVGLAVGRLAERGHRCIVYAGPSDEEVDAGYLYVTRAREAALAAARARGMTVTSVNSSRDGVEFERRLLAAMDAQPEPPGILGMSVQSLGVMNAIIRSRLGEEAARTNVVFIGWDGFDAELQPGQAFIRNSIRTLATMTVDAIVDGLGGRPYSGGYAPLALREWPRSTE